MRKSISNYLDPLQTKHNTIFVYCFNLFKLIIQMFHTKKKKKVDHSNTINVFDKGVHHGQDNTSKRQTRALLCTEP